MNKKQMITLVAVGCMSWLGLTGCDDSREHMRKLFPDGKTVLLTDAQGRKYAVQHWDQNAYHIDLIQENEP